MTLRLRLILLALAGLLGALVLGLVGLWGQERLIDASRAQVGAASVLRHQLEADMMHDAIKADLLEAVIAGAAGDAEGVAGARAGFDEHAAWMRRAIAANQGEEVSPTLREAAATVVPTLEAYLASAEAGIGLVEAGGQPELGGFETAYDELATAMEALSGTIEAEGEAISGRAAAMGVTIERRQMATLAGLVLALGALSAWILLSVRRDIGGEPVEAARATARIAEGDLDTPVPVRPGDQRSLLAKLQHMQRQLRERIAAERTLAAENLRVVRALDGSSTAMMIADASRTIVYCNPAVIEVLRAQEPALRAALPHFDIARVVGSNIDGFHVRPAH